MPSPTFTKGNRVKLSPAGIATLIRLPAERRGTIIHTVTSGGNPVAVRWDGTRHPQYFDPIHLQRAN
jgi:hypothetical protein